MCLFAKYGRNPKYKENQKNGGIIPTVYDTRVLYVPIQCGNCIECREKYSREWQIRLQEDIKINKNAKFVTLTFSDEWILKIIEGYKNKKGLWVEGIKKLEGYDRDNEIATRAVRHWMERWRKYTGKSIRHWLITELGHEGTKNIHLHGIIWTDHDLKEIEQKWEYGWVWKGKEDKRTGKIINYVNQKTTNYITKYITKVDEEHKTYKSKILSTDGIGKAYTESYNASKNKFNGDKTNETYRTSSGHKMAIPVYWRNKIYNEEEREMLWIQKLNKEERYVCGEKVSLKNGYEKYNELVEWHRKRNKELGYGDNRSNEELKQYEKECRNIMVETRMQRAREKQIKKVGKLRDKWEEEIRRIEEEENKIQL